MDKLLLKGYICGHTITKGDIGEQLKPRDIGGSTKPKEDIGQVDKQ